MVWSSRCSVNFAALATLVSFSTVILYNNPACVSHAQQAAAKAHFGHACLCREHTRTSGRPLAPRSAHSGRAHSSWRLLTMAAVCVRLAARQRGREAQEVFVPPLCRVRCLNLRVCCLGDRCGIPFAKCALCRSRMLSDEMVETRLFDWIEIASV